MLPLLGFIRLSLPEPLLQTRIFGLFCQGLLVKCSGKILLEKGGYCVIYEGNFYCFIVKYSGAEEVL